MAEIYRLGVLASGGGSTVEYVQKAINSGELPNTEIAFLACNSSEQNDPGVWERARRLHIPIFHISNVTEERTTGHCTLPKVLDDETGLLAPAKGTISMEVSEKLLHMAHEHGIHMYAGLGYLKRFIGPVLEELNNANLHPTPLPATAGKHGEDAHKEIMRRRLSYGGAVFHWMDKKVGENGLPAYDIVSAEDIQQLRIGRDRFKVTRRMRREWRLDGTVTRLQAKGMDREKRLLVEEWIPEAERQLGDDA